MVTEMATATKKKSPRKRVLPVHVYLRPEQNAKSLFFDYIWTVKGQRFEPPISADQRGCRRSQKESEARRWSVLLGSTSPRGRRMSAQVKANSTEIDLGLTHAAGRAETADSSIPHAAEHELKRRSNIAKSKISKLMRSLKGYDIVAEERSPFKMSHRSLESSGEIIARRKRVKQAQELFEQRGSRNRRKPPTSPMERQIRLSLGLEKTEDCAMCTQTFPKGTLKHEVTKKAIYEWRRLQKDTSSKVGNTKSRYGVWGRWLCVRFQRGPAPQPQERPLQHATGYWNEHDHHV